MNFYFSNFVFSFCFLDDDCRTSVETSAFLLISFLSGDNDLLLKITKVLFVNPMKRYMSPLHPIAMWLLCALSW